MKNAFAPVRKAVSAVKLNIGFWLGIVLFAAVYFMPEAKGLPLAAQKTAAVTLLMICWWIFEAIPIPATSLVPLAAFPLLGIMPGEQAAAPYANDSVFLFLGGFCLAIAMEKWNLHRRIALHIIRIVGMKPKQIVLGFMTATAFISMWISNTAAAMIMLPIGLAIMNHFHRDETKVSNFGGALMLSIAYSASIGGIGTLIGTPPNIVFAGQMKIMFPEIPEVGFFQWMLVGVPLVVIFIPITWWYLTSVAFPIKNEAANRFSVIIEEELVQLGKMRKAEKLVLAVFILTGLAWIFRPGWSSLLGLGKSVNDATVAVIAGLALFIIPVDAEKRKCLLDWQSASAIPWGILLLFGAGFSLANAFSVSGLSLAIGESIKAFSGLPPVALIAMICLLITFLTEVTSNTATAVTILPVLGAMSLSLGVHPYVLMLPATMSASCAFMTPVGTPPNAIVFSSGQISMKKMAETGLALNFIGVGLVTFIVYFLATAAFGISDLAARQGGI